MFQTTYIFVGCIAFGLSLATLSRMLATDVQIAVGTASFIVWIVWAFQSYSVEVVTDGGVIVSKSFGALAILGLAGAGVMLAFVILNIMEMFGMDPRREFRVRV